MLSVLTVLFKSWQSIVFTASHGEQLKYDGIVFMHGLFVTLPALSNMVILPQFCIRYMRS